MTVNQAMELAMQQVRAGRLTDAAGIYQQIITAQPNNADARNNLGILLTMLGRPAEAVNAFRDCLRLQPNSADVLNNLGNALRDARTFDEAESAYREAIRLQPDLPDAHNGLGGVLQQMGQIDDAIAALRRAIQLNPAFAMAYNNLGNALKDAGELDEAIAAFRRAIQLQPDLVIAHNSLIYTLQFHPGVGAKTLDAERAKWQAQHAEPLKHFRRPHGNDRTSDRRLRIGYVSPDFRTHAESFFTVPLLEHHDHERFEIHGYSNTAAPDGITERLRRACDAWHEVSGLDEVALADQIRNHGIDILVDLTMHMGNTRLRAFACKPAPLQVSWLAYPGTTGLDAIDFRLADPFLEPTDAGSGPEAPVRLPHCFVCYDPLARKEEFPVSRRSGTSDVWFGSLNNPCKINEPLLRLWGRLLLTVPDSRLMLLVYSQSHRTKITDLLGEIGISPDRLEFVGPSSRGDYLRRYNEIDICLDTRPYNGITTTCDALWMGVPVVTLVGATPPGRAGVGILSTIGLPDLVAHSPHEFEEAAANLAADAPRRSELRATLRDRLEASPLMNAPQFAADVESAYRNMWTRFVCRAT
jgi:predicted O-linked N-acetylglucosamine transferase (SPINDLY family)